MTKLFHQSIGRLRSTKILALMLIVVLVTMLSAPLRAGASDRNRIPDTFSILLSGKYRPVVHGPNLGLLQVGLSDGSFSTTKILRVSGLPKEDGDGDHDRDRG